MAEQRGPGRPPVTPDTVQLTVSMSRETVERLRAQPRPMAASVRLAVAEWLPRQERLKTNGNDNR